MCCVPFDSVGLEDVDYTELLEAKAGAVRALFGELIPSTPSGLEVIPSPRNKHYRQRCRFAVVEMDNARHVTLHEYPWTEETSEQTVDDVAASSCICPYAAVRDEHTAGFGGLH